MLVIGLIQIMKISFLGLVHDQISAQHRHKYDTFSHEHSEEEGPADLGQVHREQRDKQEDGKGELANEHMEALGFGRT